jgi:hypothetical protein
MAELGGMARASTVRVSVEELKEVSMSRDRGCH